MLAKDHLFARTISVQEMIEEEEEAAVSAPHNHQQRDVLTVVWILPSDGTIVMVLISIVNGMLKRVDVSYMVVMMNLRIEEKRQMKPVVFVTVVTEVAEAA